VTNTKVGVPGEFVGLANFVKIWNDGIFRVRGLQHLPLHAFITRCSNWRSPVAGAAAHRHFRGKACARLHPAAVHHPDGAVDLRLEMMFDPTFSVLYWVLFKLGIITGRVNWLGDPELAMVSIIIVNVWRGVPFYAISLLAGLQTISPELHEAAAIDGAPPWSVSGTSPGRCCCRDHGRGAVLGHPDLSDFGSSSMC